MMRLSVGLHVGFAMVLIAAILAIIAVRNVAWAAYTKTDYEILYGLFYVCVTFRERESCHKVDEPHEKLESTQAMAVIGMVCLIISTIFICIYMFLHYKDNSRGASRVPLICSIIAACIGGLFNTIANGIYGDYNENSGLHADDAYLYYSFYLVIVSTLLGVSGSFVAYFGRPKPIQPANGAVVMTTTGNVTIIQQPYAGSSAMTNPAYPPQPYGKAPPPYSSQGYNAYGNPAYPPANYGPSPAYPPVNPVPVTPVQPPAYSGDNPAFPPAPSVYQPPAPASAPAPKE